MVKSKSKQIQAETPQRFNVLVGELSAAMLFASEDESRFVLCSVHVRSRGAMPPVITATDGRRLCIIESAADQEMTDGSFRGEVILSAGFLKPFCAFSKSQAGTLAIELHPPKRAIFHLALGKIVLDCEEGAVIEGVYPNTNQVIPTGDKVPVSQLGLNPQYVTDFAKAAKFLGKSSVLQMNMFAEDKAIEVRMEGLPNFYGIIMPCKTDMASSQPEFILK
jgi:hypothetical protein